MYIYNKLINWPLHDSSFFGVYAFGGIPSLLWDMRRKQQPQEREAPLWGAPLLVWGVPPAFVPALKEGDIAYMPGGIKDSLRKMLVIY
jgi:hypothetical protein